MKRSFVYILILFLLCSCSSNKRHYVIAVSQCSEDIWRSKLNEELLMSTYYNDNVELRFASAKDNDKLQEQQINKFIDDDVNLIIVSPNQIHTASKAIDRAYDKGIPVILFDRKTDSKKYTAFIGADNYAVGRAMGNYVCTQLGGNGNVVEIQGLRGSSPAIERHRGFADALKAYPGVHLLCSPYCNWLEQSAKEVMDSVLKTQTNIDCVFGQNDRMALGARTAIMQHGLKNKVMFVGVDALPNKGGGMRQVMNQNLTASYIYPTRGDMVMQLALNILNGKKYEKENYLKAAIVTRDNAKAMLMQVDEINNQNQRIVSLHGMVDKYLAEYNYQKVYLLLFFIILVLVTCFFVYVNRTIAMKRRLTEETANAKLQFFTNVSHEFRTPLTLIADPVERLIDDGNLNDSQRSLLRIVDKNVKVLLRLVGEILDFRKIENNKMTLNVSQFDMAQSIRKWTEGFTSLAAKHSISLSLDLPESLMVCADAEKMERIYFNLLSNAIKYSRDGGHIVVTSKMQDSQMMMLSVADDGIGIPKDKVQHVFDRFYQARNSNVGGTGIGLALVKAFAELHHGKVTVDSEEGRGTTFTVVMPVVNQSAEDAETMMQKSLVTDAEEHDYAIKGDTVPNEDNSLSASLDKITSEDEAKDNEKILIVDDNDDVRSYVSSLLSSQYDIVQAVNGQEGMEKAIREVPDLIVCDVMMPVMDGMEMCRRVKSEMATSHIPVILLTAITVDNKRAEGYDCGADAFITKPFSGKVLMSRIRNLLENRRKLKFIFSNADEQEDSRPTDVNTKFIEDFRSKVQSHLSDSELNVETLSAEMGLSRVQMYRKVKALTGSSPVELIRITRLKKAERLLMSGGKTIAEISYEVGFSSPSYFTKCYKDYFGKLPNESL
jgi:signal transduction histidine kinase/DNA-binding response OmpR family regulator